MAVYVDDMKAGYGRMILCHMIADTRGELIAMANLINLNPKWLQHAGTHKEHFDICLAKRKAAVANGAIEVSQHELGRIILSKRGNDYGRTHTTDRPGDVYQRLQVPEAQTGVEAAATTEDPPHPR